MKTNSSYVDVPSTAPEDIQCRTLAVFDSLYRKKHRNKVMHTSDLSHADIQPGVKITIHETPESPYKCSDNCSVCFPQFFPVAGILEDEQAARLINSIVATIQSDLSYLLRSLSEHGDMIVARWKKKTRTKRSQFLKDNTDLFDRKWAPIYLLDLLHQPSFGSRGSGLFKSPRDNMKARTIATVSGNRSVAHKYEHTWFLPYLNVETLAEDPSLLLKLLHLRTSEDIGGWRMFDRSQLHLAEDLSIIAPLFNKHCVVMAGPSFGQLVPWSYEGMHRHLISGFPQARLILTAEKAMLELLRKCVSGILCEISPPATLTPQTRWLELVVTGFGDMESQLGWPRGTIETMQRPVFTPNHLVQIIESRYDEARDHIELLQTDPEYFQLQASQISTAFTFEGEDETIKWTLIADDLILEAIRREAFWRQLSKEARLLSLSFKALVESLSDQTEDTEHSRDIFHLTVYWLQDFCVTFFGYMRLRLELSVSTSRGFEDKFEYVKNNKSGRLRKRPLLIGDHFHEDVLFWSLISICYDDYRAFEMHPTFNFAIIDDVCRNNPRDAERMNQRTRDLVDDMSVFCNMVSHIEMQRMRDRASIPSQFWKLKETDESQKSFMLKLERLLDLPLGQKIGSLLANHVQRACSTSWPRGFRTHRWLEQATVARDALDVLWQAARTIWATELKQVRLSKHEIDEDMDVLSESLRAAVRSTLAAEKQAIMQEEEARVQSRAQSGSGYRPFESKSAQASTAQKSKIQPDRQAGSLNKGRQYAGSIVTSRSASLPSPPPRSTPVSSVNVHKNSLDLFHHMFPQNHVEGQRSFSWQHFLSAMADAGMIVSQKHGSAVTFASQTNEDYGSRSIVIHRPHPDSTINPVMLRTIGKRIAKWLSWQRDTFVERER
jgi:hypothetical protein